MARIGKIDPRALGCIALAGLFLAMIVYRQAVRAQLLLFLDWVDGIGPWGPVVYGAAYIVACVAFVPGLIPTLGAGFLFGWLVGSVTVSIASTIGATAAFGLGRTLGRGYIASKVAANPRFRALDEAVGQNAFQVVLLTRLSPLFPFNLLNYAFGVTTAPLGPYVLASWIGMLPATIVFVYTGSLLGSLTELLAGRREPSVARLALYGLGLFATVAVMLVITRIARAALRRTVPLDAKSQGGTNGP